MADSFRKRIGDKFATLIIYWAFLHPNGGSLGFLNHQPYDYGRLINPLGERKFPAKRDLKKGQINSSSVDTFASSHPSFLDLKLCC